MTTLSDKEIKEIISYRPEFIDPFVDQKVYFGALSYGLEPSGYDIRLGDQIGKWFSGMICDPCQNILPEHLKMISIDHPGHLLGPGQMVLGRSLEEFNLPTNIQAVVYDKSTLIRLGIAVQNTKLACGWRGILTLEITNHGPHSVTLRAGMPIAQLEFTMVKEPDIPYHGRYQGQDGVTPAQRIGAVL
jgi:dCTP deaminase